MFEERKVLYIIFLQILWTFDNDEVAKLSSILIRKLAHNFFKSVYRNLLSIFRQWIFDINMEANWIIIVST